MIGSGNLGIILSVLAAYKIIDEKEAEFLLKNLKGKIVAKGFQEKIEQIKDVKIDYENTQI